MDISIRLCKASQFPPPPKKKTTTTTATTTTTTTSKEPASEIKSTAVLPYIKGPPEALRRDLQQQGIHTVFKFDTTLRSHLVQPKDVVDPTKQDGVVYKILCECGKVYIGETERWMHERIKEHDRDIRLARTQTCLRTCK